MAARRLICSGALPSRRGAGPGSGGSSEPLILVLRPVIRGTRHPPAGQNERHDPQQDLVHERNQVGDDDVNDEDRRCEEQEDGRSRARDHANPEPGGEAAKEG